MSFARLGYEVARDVLPPHAVALARELSERLIERHRSGEQSVDAASVSVASAGAMHPSRNPGVRAAEWPQEPFIVGDLAALEPRFSLVLSIEALWHCAARVLGCAMPEVVFHTSNLTRKPAGIGPAIGWHRDADNSYFAADDCRTVRLLLPLQPMSAANGGTEVLPGSHVPPLDRAAPKPGGTVCPPVAPGSALVLHAQVLHGGSPNRSPHERDVIVVQFGVRSSRLRCQAHEVLSNCDWQACSRFALHQRGQSVADNGLGRGPT